MSQLFSMLGDAKLREKRDKMKAEGSADLTDLIMTGGGGADAQTSSSGPFSMNGQQAGPVTSGKFDITALLNLMK